MISKKTITSVFMLPTLSVSREELHKNGFINAFIDDKDKEYHFEDAIYLLFKPENIDAFRSFLDGEYERTKKIIDDYDYEGGYVVVVYKLDMSFSDDFDLIKKGKYSKTSRRFQNLFPEKVKMLTKPEQGLQTSLQHMIFKKDERLIDFWEERIGKSDLSIEMECWPVFNEEREILDINNLEI